MKKRIVSATLCLVLAASAVTGVSATSLVGVGDNTVSEGNAGASEEAVVSGDDVSADAQASEPATADNSQDSAPDGQAYSYLSGLPVDASVRDTRPMSVMIDNVSAATPQSGIGSAWVIYEAPAQYDYNRLLAFFEDYADVDRIGPVRSCRPCFIDFATEFDAIYAHYGQVVYAFDTLNTDIVDNISGLQYQDAAGELLGYAGEDIYYRDESRAAPHNVYTNYDMLQLGIERNEYRTQIADDYSGHFLFAPDGERVTYTDGTADYIRPDLYDNQPYFEYDAQTGKYNRFQFGGPHIDDLTGEQLAFDNVIIQYCEFTAADDNGYWFTDMVSGGDAILFTNGTYQNAHWEKESEWGPAKYYDASGNQIAINQGKTFVCVVQNSVKDDLEIR